MAGPDRRHAHGVARRVERALGDEATRPVLAAALLHDVGKTDSGLGTYGRVVATLSAKVAGRDMAAWSADRGFTRRVGLYLLHPELGADLLRLAGSDPLTVASSARADDPRRPLGDALKAADDDCSRVTPPGGPEQARGRSVALRRGWRAVAAGLVGADGEEALGLGRVGGQLGVALPGSAAAPRRRPRRCRP